MTTDLKNVKTIVCGIQGSGKTYFTEHELITAFKNPFVYLMHKEDFKSCAKNVHVYIPQVSNKIDTSMTTLEMTISAVIELGKKKKIDAFVLDEADMFLPKDIRTLQKFRNLYDLIINHRHYGLALIFITRRPQSIPTEVMESSEHLFVFKIEGDNVMKKLTSIHPDFENLMPQLDKKRHNYIYKKLG